MKVRPNSATVDVLAAQLNIYAALPRTVDELHAWALSE